MRFRKFLKPYKTRDSSFREYTIILGGVSGKEKGRRPSQAYFSGSRL